uniref:Uncharacterized protein n=1 Tax=Parastrongyloides trichosuri TaxID=131310 RepID=A0A0N4ZVW0_PARTI
MIKTFLFVLLTVALFNGIYGDGKVCGGQDVKLNLKGKFLCQGQPSKTFKLKVEGCSPETGNCKKFKTKLGKDGELTTLTTTKIVDLYDEFDLIVSHDCGDCSGAFRIPIPEEAINCNKNEGKVADLGEIELTSEEYC